VKLLKHLLGDTPPLGSFREITDMTPDVQSAINRGDIAESLLESSGWKLLLDEFEALGNEALQRLRTGPDEDILPLKLRWEITEKLIEEIQVRIIWHKELKEQLLREQQLDDQDDPSNSLKTTGDSNDHRQFDI
jgi:hypothetical protein